jgi:hypothetical protein
MDITPENIANSFGSYIRGVPESVPVKEVIPPIDDYRKHVAQRFITRREEDIPTLKGKEFIVSVKVDGAFTGYYYNKEKSQSFFFNVPQHRIYIGLPVEKELVELLEKKLISEILLVGELFASTHQPIDFTKRSRIYELVHYRRNPSSEEDLNRIGFQVFDILSVNGKDWMKKEYLERYNKIKTIFPKQGRLSLVKTELFTNPYEILEFYQKEVIKNNQEGIVVRTGNIAYKIKPIHIIDVAIIGIAPGREGTKIKKNQLASTLVALRYPDGKYQILSRVGGGLNDDQRTDLWGRFTIVNSKDFIPITRDARAMKMVKPEVVGQIAYEDIITDSGGDPIYQSCVIYDEKEKSWEVVRKVPFLALVSPRFIEEDPIRDDKNAENITDVRISQIMDLVDIPKFESIAKYELDPSQVLARNVYEKRDSMVRKFLLLKTNKSKAGDYPEYVIYNLDYSSNRKDPLKRDMKITNNEKQAHELFSTTVNNEMIGTKGDLKRGWKEYSISS